MIVRYTMAALLLALPIAASAQPKTASLETRLQRVEDELAINRILIDYAAFLDGRDYASYAGLFAPDGEWTNSAGSHKGQAAIRQMLEGTMGKPNGPNRSNYHIISNPRIDLNGDHATATSHFLFTMRGQGGSPTPSLAGVYHDEFVKLNGQWKIQRRVADNVMPTSEEWGKIMAAQQQVTK